LSRPRSHAFSKGPWRDRNVEFLSSIPGILGEPGRRRVYAELGGRTAGESFRAMSRAGLVDADSFVALDRDREVGLELEDLAEHQVGLTDDACEKLLEMIRSGEDVGAFNFDSETSASNEDELGRFFGLLAEAVRVTVASGRDFALISNVVLVGRRSGRTRVDDVLDYRRILAGHFPTMDRSELPTDEQAAALPRTVDVHGKDVGPMQVYRSEKEAGHGGYMMLTSRHYFPSARGPAARR
jgi:hypothetical protein